MADRSSMEASVICDQMGLASPVAPFTEPYLILESRPYDAATIGQWQLAWPIVAAGGPSFGAAGVRHNEGNFFRAPTTDVFSLPFLISAISMN